jgi:hypothetical protein
MSQAYTPSEYVENYRRQYKLPVSAAAYDLAMSEGNFRRYAITTKNKRKPSTQTCRVVQLLDFIRQNGLEPPAPVFFE